MQEQTIKCPNCGTDIPLTETLSLQIKQQLESEFAEKQKEKETEIAKRLEEIGSAQENLRLEREQQEKAMLEKQRVLEEESKARMETERIAILAQAKSEAQKQLGLELDDLKNQNEEKKRQLEQFQKNELEIRRKMREIEEEKQNLDLEMQRRLDEEKGRIASAAKQEADEENRRKMIEKDMQMEQLRKTIEELKRKSEQGSMQVQGDAQEEELKALLASTFPYDVVEDVPTGIKGADLIQRVHSKFGQQGGIILWESKNTKAWSSDWVKKLKGDQGIAKADVCILVSRTLPEGMKGFGLMEGVWVCEYQFAMPLALVLRTNLLEINNAKQSGVGKNEKMEMLYAYLSGSQFRNRIENIVMAFSGMKTDLDAEKRAMHKIWSKREKEIERVIENTSGMYGDLEGIVGSAALPQVDSLSLPE